MGEAPSWTTWAVPLVIALIGAASGVWNYLQARLSRQVGVRQTDIDQESTAVTGLKELATMLRAEVDSLRDDRDEDRREIAALRAGQEQDRAAHREGMAEMRAKHDEVVEENRTFRAVILGVLERLRRRPPDEPESIYKFIIKHLPHLGKDPS